MLESCSTNQQKCRFCLYSLFCSLNIKVNQSRFSPNVYQYKQTVQGVEIIVYSYIINYYIIYQLK